MTATTKTPAEVFAVLNNLLNSKAGGPVVQQRVHAHLRAATGGRFNLLINYHNSAEVEDGEKVRFYREVISAIVSRKLDSLQGQLAKGDKRLDPMDLTDSPSGDSPSRPQGEGLPPGPQGEPKAEPKPAPTVIPTPEEGDHEDAATLLAKAIAKLKASGKGELDEARVRDLAAEVSAEHGQKLVEHILGIVKDHVAQAVKTSEPPIEKIRELVAKALEGVTQRLEIVQPNGEVRPISGLAHKQLPEILKMASARDRGGYPVPLWLDGPPGGGKSHIFEQLAEAFGVAAYVKAISPTDTSSVIVGFKNLATGQYVPGIAREPYENGGILGIDEIANGDPGIIVSLNSMLSQSSFRFPDGTLVKKHQNFFCIVGDNTRGKGSTGGFVRNKLDAASLDRFVMRRLDYDHDLEIALCGSKPWADYVLKVREFVSGSVPESLYITPRASINGAALLRAGVEPDLVCDCTLFKLCSAETKTTILQNVGAFRS
ncbi:MAG: AAA family ATPase [Verrucomicrobiota bacterium]